MVDKNQIEGEIKESRGRAQELEGAAEGDTSEELKGKAKQAAGDAQEAYGAAKEELSD